MDLTGGLCRGGAGRWEVLGEVDVAHVAAAAAEVVRPVLDLRREVGDHAAVVAAALLVAQVIPAAWRREATDLNSPNIVKEDEQWRAFLNLDADVASWLMPTTTYSYMMSN